MEDKLQAAVNLALHNAIENGYVDVVCQDVTDVAYDLLECDADVDRLAREHTDNMDDVVDNVVNAIETYRATHV